VENVILIPRFAFPLSAIEKRKPLAETARRAGWVGCNILLQQFRQTLEKSSRTESLSRLPQSAPNTPGFAR
jgi:hypothetical protein